MKDKNITVVITGLIRWAASTIRDLDRGDRAYGRADQRSMHNSHNPRLRKHGRQNRVAR